MRPLITPLNLRLRHVKQALFSTAAILLILLAVLPDLITVAIRYQVPRMGFGQVEIGNIDLNLFRGKLLLEEVGLYRSAARVFSLRRAEVDFGVLSLFERRLHLQSVAIEGLSLTVKQQGQQALQIAGIPLPAKRANEPAAPAVADKKQPWSFGIDAMDISDSSLQLIHPRFPETVQLHKLSLGPLATWRPEYVTPLNLRLAIAGGELRLKAKINPFASEPQHRLELTINSLPLASFALLADPLIGQLQGELSTQMTLLLTQHASQRLSLSQQGEFSLSGLGLRSGDTTVRQQGVYWNGRVTLADMAKIETLKLEGDLKVTGTGVTVAGRKEPALSLRQLTLSDMKLSGSSQFTLAELSVEGLVTEAARTSHGMTVPGLPAATAVAEGREGAEAASLPAAPDATPFQFRIERLRISGDNRFTFADQTVKPPFRHSLTLTEGELLHIDSNKPQQTTKIMLKGRDDYYTTFSVEGEGKLFAPLLAVKLKGRVENFDMPPTSPYLAKLLGYRITTGQLDSDMSMQIENNELKGEFDLRMNQLQLKPEDPARIEEFQSKTVMPLNTALSLLRDKNDNIKLKLPISGRLDDPQFALDDVINTALGTALKAGSVSYLKHLLQPYGTLITVVQLAGKVAGHINLDPVMFAPGSAELQPDAGEYLGKIAQLVTQKAVNIQFCGFATTADLISISKGREQAIPPTGHAALEELAKQRAESIKAMLVKSYGVDPKQLFVCHPELDPASEALPRVELAI